MQSRALILAAVTFMLCGLAAAPVAAQNLEAGKPPSAIFSSTCSLCHKSSRGLLKSVPPGSLPGFLRQHYTTSSDMAGSMAAYVLSNGAANAALPGGNLTRQGEDSRTAPKPSATPEARPEQASREAPRDNTKGGRKPVREASRPDVDGLENIPNVPEPAAEENARPSDSVRPPETSRPADAAKPDAKSKSAKGRAKGDPKEARRDEAPKPDVVTRPDPVPEVTPAPAEEGVKPQAPKSVAELPTGPLSIDMGTPPPQTVTTEPAGPPRVPISQ